MRGTGSKRAPHAAAAPHAPAAGQRAAGRAALALVAGVVLLLAVPSCGTGGGGVPTPEFDVLPSLNEIWAPYFPVGNIVSSVNYSWRPARVADLGNQAREELLVRQFSIITAEDEMKPDWLRPQPHTWNAAGADRIMAFAQEHGLRVHGHTLVWHSQTPAWMYADGDRARSAEAIANMQYHIERVMRHFGDAIESWDVLNEVFPSTVGGGVSAGNWRNFLRGYSGWLRAIGSNPNGDCFIWIAFTTARRIADEINPNMVLYYNDYNLDSANKRLAVYYMVREMNERFARENNGRRLIDAIGMQAHYHASGQGSGAAYPWGPTSPGAVGASIQRFASLGLYVSITELDVTIGNVTLSPRMERQQANLYAQLFQVFRDNAGSIRRVSIWGIDDPASWRARGNPLLFGSNLRPKEAFWAAANPDAFRRNANAYLADPKAFIDERFWR